jgi:hypothetical protein
MTEGFQYCPVCGRTIEASNREEVKSGEHEGYLFVHDDIVHDDSDIEALERGVQ